MRSPPRVWHGPRSQAVCPRVGGWIAHSRKRGKRARQGAPRTVVLGQCAQAHRACFRHRGIYENYEQLAQRGWNLTEAAVQTIASAGPAGATATAASTSAAQASFEQANSPLYIDAIYDGHFDLSLLGKSLASGYEKLGGPGAFGARRPRPRSMHWPAPIRSRRCGLSRIRRGRPRTVRRALGRLGSRCQLSRDTR